MWAEEVNLAAVARINAEVNLLPFVPQVGDDWNPWTKNGFDCNNFATRKETMLEVAGLALTSMRLATCWVEPFRVHDAMSGVLRDATMDERYHAVLLVDLDGQTYVCCNRKPYPTEYDICGYRFHKLQRWHQDGSTDWEFA